MTEIEQLNAEIDGLLRELAEARDVLQAEEAKEARRIATDQTGLEERERPAP